MKHTLSLFAMVVLSSLVFSQNRETTTKARQDSIIAKYLKRGAWKHGYFDKEWDQYINQALAEDSTIAYLWQQKAMPYYKHQKYEIAAPYLDKAVQYDQKWLDYRAFMKCIFVKNYSQALADFELCNQLQPGGYIMDHSYDFYIALCHLQLNEYPKACELLNRIVAKTIKTKGREWVHPTELFYLGIAYYELGNYDKAIEIFDQAIVLYPRFSDAKYYKGKCLVSLHQDESSKIIIREAVEDFEKGYTINEDSIIYERYPYQVYYLKGYKL